MKGRDEIKDLFSDKLGNFEAQVRPDMWANIASQIGGTATSVASTGLSLLSKTFIGIGIGAAVITTVLLVTPSETTSIEKNAPINTTSNTEINKEESPSINTNEEIVTEPIVSQHELDDKTTETHSEPQVNKEIDQNQNFKGDISLIDVKKEKPEIETPVVKKEVAKEKPEVKETKTVSKSEEKAPIKEVVKETVNQTEPKTTYTLEKLPNVFTPDGDGANDIFSVSSEGLIDFNIVVFDNKQTVVFESTNPDFKWDGTDKGGNKVKSGTYGYYIIAQDSNGNKVNKFTSLQIVF